MEELMLKMKDFFLKNEQKIVLVVGFLLISAISFEFGVLQGAKWQQKPLIIEKPTQTPEQPQTTQNEPSGVPQKKLGAAMPASGSQSGCAFVGSKNSAKFYVPTCTWAKRIKPENMVCYKSEQEAISKGKTKSDCK